MLSKRSPPLFRNTLEAIAELEFQNERVSEKKVNMFIEKANEYQCKKPPTNLKNRVKIAVLYGLQAGILKKQSGGIKYIIGPKTIEKMRKADIGIEEKEGSKKQQARNKYKPMTPKKRTGPVKQDMRSYNKKKEMLWKPKEEKYRNMRNRKTRMRYLKHIPQHMYPNSRCCSHCIFNFRKLYHKLNDLDSFNHYDAQRDPDLYKYQMVNRTRDPSYATDDDFDSEKMLPEDKVNQDPSNEDFDNDDSDDEDNSNEKNEDEEDEDNPDDIDDDDYKHKKSDDKDDEDEDGDKGNAGDEDPDNDEDQGREQDRDNEPDSEKDGDGDGDEDTKDGLLNTAGCGNRFSSASPQEYPKYNSVIVEHVNTNGSTMAKRVNSLYCNDYCPASKKNSIKMLLGRESRMNSIHNRNSVGLRRSVNSNLRRSTTNQNINKHSYARLG